jgi:hypothetical protein
LNGKLNWKAWQLRCLRFPQLWCWEFTYSSCYCEWQGFDSRRFGGTPRLHLEGLRLQ